MAKKKPVKKPVSYKAKLGCWNCDNVYHVAVKLGTNTPQYLMEKDPTCKHCGCTTLKMFAEWKVEKKILKDLILHGKITAIENEQVLPKRNHDHIQ